MVTKIVSGPSRLKRWVPQLMAGWSVTCILIQLGLSSGWSSPYIPKLRRPDSSIQITDSEASWIAALLNLGRFLGALLGSVSVNYFGCKKTLLLTLLPMASCWSCIILADSAIWLYVGRLAGGIGLGMTYSSFPLFIGEISLPEVRGAMVSLAACGATFGLMLGNVIGAWLDMEVSAAAYLMFCCVLILIFLYLPESPHHLLKYGKQEKARRSIEWYRGGYQVDEEFEAISKFLAKSTAESFCQKLQEFKTPYIFRATLLVVAIFSFQQLSGFNSVLFYMQPILEDAGVTIVEPAKVVNYVSGAGVLASALSITLIDRCGRRLLLVLSSIGVALALAMLGLHFNLIRGDLPEPLATSLSSISEEVGIDNLASRLSTIDNPELQYLPIVAMFIFMTAFFLGLMPTPSALMAEVFPANIKCIASCIGSLAGALFAFVSTKTYQPLIDWLGQSFVFYLYAGVTIVIVPYALICMPETKGKTLQQIQEKLVRRS